jgi:hypothetical protein
VAEHVAKMPPPTYQYSRYFDWIRPYVEHQLEESQKVGYYNSTAKKEELAKDVMIWLP